MGVNGPDLWPKCDLPEPLLPKYENRPGRPKKLRRRQPDEPPVGTSSTKLPKHQKFVKCRKCGAIGHNSRTCKSPNQTESATSNAPVNLQVPDEVPLHDSQPCNVPSQCSAKTSKLHVKRKKGSTSGGVNVSGHTNRVSSITVGQTSNVNTPFIVRGGVNYITMTNLRSAIGNHL
ncbi:hypothetical protein DH2020_039116 [Rehmannia glutinosa]|uniref:CCHC-type domain-containing protein n=1 Tax=Rehmannia glutinosa TaxID=99300 RepID=A0ABR0UZC3_REHGL